MIVLAILAGCAGSNSNAPPALATPEAGQIVVNPPTQETNEPEPEIAEPDPTQTPEYWADNDEYRGQLGLSMIVADAAYALGVSGRDVVIGFMDTGLDEKHAEFSGADIVLNDRTQLTDFDTNDLKHGTGVASVAAARRGAGAGMQGVAFNAKIAMFSIPLNSRGALDLNDTMLADAVVKLKNAGATIINQSWGYSSRVNPELLEAQGNYLTAIFPKFYEQMAAGGAIHVWAGGNKGADQVAINAGWPIFFPNLAGLSIAVVGVDKSGALGTQSNKCGAMKDYCLAAPGGRNADGSFTQVASAGTTNDYHVVHGTSFAVPYVSGVLALMREAFGTQLSAAEYTARLLATADKSGIYAASEIYGQGLVNARAALEPVGDLALPLPNGGVSRPQDNTLNGGLLPKELLEQLENEDIILLDGLDTPFSAPLLRAHHFTRPNFRPSIGKGVRAPPTMTVQLAAYPLELHVWDFVKLDQLLGRTATIHPFLTNFGQAHTRLSGGVVNGWGARPHGWRLVALGAHARTDNQQPPQDALALIIENNFSLKNGDLRLQFGLLHETDGLLGSAGVGGLNMGAGNAHLASLYYQRNIGQRTYMTVLLNAAYSQIAGGDNSFVKQSDNLQAYEMRVGVARHNWSFEIGQPLHFVEGKLHLSVPTRRLAGGGVVFENRHYPLMPHQTPYGMWITRTGKKLSWHLNWQQHQYRHAGLNLVWAF